MEQRLHIGPPEPGSDREKEFNDGVQQIRDKIQSVIDKRRNGEEQESIPFIDALLQSDVPSEQVGMYHNGTLVISVTCFVLDYQVFSYIRVSGVLT